MSESQETIEATIRQELDIPEEEIVEEEVEQEEISPLMQEALDAGYKDKEAFVEAGGDPEKHVSPHEFVRYGKLQKSMREQMRRFESKEQEFEKRFEHLNQMHKMDMDSKIKALKEQQRAAVDEADGEAFDRAQVEIEAIQEQNTQPAVTTDKHPSIVKWESDKDWINDEEDIRALTAQGAWNAYIAKNPDETVENALAFVDKQLEKLAPTQVNPLRDMPTATEKGKRTAGKKRGVTMDDLTQEEREMWRNASDIWGGDQKAFLKSVEDARK
jgi:hypothetical protein